VKIYKSRSCRFFTFALFILVILADGLGSWAYAQSFVITINEYGDEDLPSFVQDAYRAAVDELVGGIEGGINVFFDDLPNPDGFMKGTANASVLAGSGIGLDYHSDFSLFNAGVQLGVTGELGSNSLASLFKPENLDLSQVNGVGAQVGFTIGVPMEIFTKGKVLFLDFSRVKLYSHFFTKGFSFSKTVNMPGATGPMEIQLSTISLGVGGAYRFISGMSLGFGAFRWDGLNFSAGLRYSSVNVSLGVPFEQVQSATADLGEIEEANFTGTFVGTPKVGANVEIFTMPLEIFTSVRLGWLVSVFGGMASDVSLGAATAIAEIEEGSLEISNNQTDGMVDADAVLDYGDSSGPTVMNLRYFVGVGFDFQVLTLSAQINQALTNGAIGANIGIKAYW
jgi:hypothetical protein